MMRRLRTGSCLALGALSLAAPAQPPAAMTDAAFAELAAGLGAMRRADWQQAERILGRFLEGHPGHVEARYQLGGALMILGRHRTAEQAFALAGRAAGFRGGAAYNGACAAALAGDRDRGFAHLATALRYGWITRRNCELDGDLRALREDGRWAALFADAARSRPQLSAGSHAIDRALDSGRFDDARQLIEAWVEEHPEDGLAFWRLGLLAERDGRWADAAAAYERCAELPFEPPVAMLGAATAHARAGDRDAALEWVERAVRAGLDPDLAAGERDLGSLRGSPELEALLSEWRWAAAPEPAYAARAREAWPEDGDWPRAEPAEQGLRAGPLRAAAAEIAAIAPRLNALLLVRGGRLVFEHYFNGTGPDHADNVKSITKSVTAALVGVALERGDLESLDTPLVELLPAAFEGLEDAGKRAITLRHLLGMTAGLQWVENGPVTTDWMHSEDMVRFALELPRAAEPGETYRYNTALIHLAGAALAEATGQDLYRFAKRSLFEPLGIGLAAWSTDRQGYYEAGSEMRITPRDLARFGLMILDGGRWDGRQVLPETWVRECLRPAGPDPSPFTGYGLTWRTENHAGHRVHYALGLGWQHVLLVPDLDMVLVLTGNSRNIRNLMRRVFQVHVLPALE